MAKLIGVLTMTAAIFPAYALARLVVSRAWALAAATVAVAAPPLAYAPYLLDEPLAYPISTLALWAVATAVARPSRRTLAVAAALCVVAPLVRGQLVVLLLVFAVGRLRLLWETDRFTRWRATWTSGDWMGAVAALHRRRRRRQRRARTPLRAVVRRDGLLQASHARVRRLVCGAP